MFFHAPGTFDSSAYERNRLAKKSLVSGGRAHGTLVYCGGVPVGWCQFGPRHELPRIDRKRGYVPTSEDAWRITCLFTDRGHRRMGISGVAVGESVEAMRKLGVGQVEAYPVEGKLSASMLWSGTPELFEAHGFRRVRPMGKSGWVYSLKLE
jgi:GNAT superfamily N-acetyltransferase